VVDLVHVSLDLGVAKGSVAERATLHSERDLPIAVVRTQRQSGPDIHHPASGVQSVETIGLVLVGERQVAAAQAAHVVGVLVNRIALEAG
jgi:hypothetical protein